MSVLLLMMLAQSLTPVSLLSMKVFIAILIKTALFSICVIFAAKSCIELFGENETVSTLDLSENDE